MKKLFFCAVGLLFALTKTVAQELPPIPVDPEVRIGKLDNGLTYYIRHNEFPEKVANFYIAQRVGSIQEEDSQRGLAHFLEHMAFNGSEHFKGNGIIDFTRSLGVEFGSNLNAYTSIDQTVYRVCDVPTTRQSALDSCLLIIKDWSNGLLLEEEEIVKERDVVHNEWRMGEGPTQRMITRDLPRMYPGSKYGERMPIGLMSVIDSFRPETLRAYYHKWYRPDNQAVIVVGDIDVDHTEAKIKEMFSGIVVPENAPKVVPEPVPDNEEPIFIFDKDKEMPINQILVFMKHDATQPEEKESMAYLIELYMKAVLSEMMNARLREMTEDPECPFLQAMADDDVYLLARTKDAFQMVGVPKDGKDMETLKALIRESRRASKFGFTATEYDRAKAEYLADLEKQYTNRDKRRNAEFGDAYRDNYLNNEPIPPLDMLYQIMQQIVPNIPVEAINQALPELISDSDKNLVVVEWAREADNITYPTEDDMKAAVAAARAEQIEGYVDNVKDEPLMTQLPVAGKITGETENQTLGYKELKLSNGVTVLLKKTDFKDDEVQLQAWSKGGQSLYDAKDFTNMKVFNEIIGASGLGNFSNSELEKVLAGKKCNADATMDLTRQYMTAHSTPKDLETMFQMMYLYFTAVNKDEKRFQNLMNIFETQLKNKHLQPQAVFADSLTLTMYSHNPRFSNIQVEDLKDVSYDRILEIQKERFQNASQFTFVIVGNFDEQTIRPFIEQYVASLPGKGKPENFRDVRTPAMGEVKNNFIMKTESPNAMSYEIWTAKMPYNLENSVKIDALGQVLSQIYLATIREEESAAYTCGAYGGFDNSGTDSYARLIGVTQGNPEKNARAVELLLEGAKKSAEKFDADILTKVKAYMLKQADDDAKNNGHWVNILTTWKYRGLDMQTDYKKTVEALTPEVMQQFLQQILAAGNHTEVIMMPEK
ncbi:MAG: insulinase family protein [Prevotella sp.]|nr:insulinase family protein [Prevotella sp.]